MGKAFSFETSCVNADGDDITAMCEAAREVSYQTLVRRVGRPKVAGIFADYDWRRRPRELTLRRDWHVSYHRSRYRGRACYYVRHSAIEYVFVEGAAHG